MITAIVSIVVDPSRIPEVAQSVVDIDGVEQVYSVTGDVDLIALGLELLGHLEHLVPREPLALARVHEGLVVVVEQIAHAREPTGGLFRTDQRRRPPEGREAPI